MKKFLIMALGLSLTVVSEELLPAVALVVTSVVDVAVGITVTAIRLIDFVCFFLPIKKERVRKERKKEKEYKINEYTSRTAPH